jgi:hypothetical protein
MILRDRRFKVISDNDRMQIPGVAGTITAGEMKQVVEDIVSVFRAAAEGDVRKVEALAGAEITQRSAAVFVHVFDRAIERGAKWETVVVAMKAGAPPDFAVFAAEMHMPVELVQTMGKLFTVDKDGMQELVDEIAKQMGEQA